MDISKLPEIKFAKADAEEILSTAQKCFAEILGRHVERSDPLMLVFKVFLSVIMQERERTDHIAKQNLLAYAEDNPLEHIGAVVGVSRHGSKAAVSTVEVELSAPREVNTIIRAGTRITAGDGVMFALDNAVIFAPHETLKTAKVTCLETGDIGNGYAPNELRVIVDPQSFLQSIRNITTSEGGEDTESNSKLRDRIAIAPESFSVAGARGAYDYFTKQVSGKISDVLVTTERPGQVAVYPLLEGGELPGEELLAQITEALSGEKVRPFTDELEVKVPRETEYKISVTYYIARSKISDAEEIISSAENAVDDFILWQSSTLGRDINPSELTRKLQSAGVKRVEIVSPIFEIVEKNSVARCTEKILTYGGIEDD